VSQYAAPGGHRQGDPDQGPKYKRVARNIAADIQSGVLKPGIRLLGERELAKHLGMSTGTIRNAVRQLRDDGYVYTQHGEGTFVIGPKPPAEPEPEPG
jgi:DNA-binding GntR family transcriptional regulator